MKTSLLILCTLVNIAISKEYKSFDEVDCRNDQNTTYFYLNGIDNQPSDSHKSREKISEIIQVSDLIFDRRGKTNICYKYVYNQTDSLFDWVEALAQKIREAKPDLSDEEVYKMVSKLIMAPSIVLAPLIPSPIPTIVLTKILADSIAERVKKAEDDTLKIFTTPIIKKELESNNVLLISHSQGNLFANSIYKRLSEDSSLDKRRLKRFANMQVATPAGRIEALPNSYADYITLKQDRVITPIGTLPIFGLLPPNIETESIVENNFETIKYPIYDYDLVGHNFRKVYLNEDVKGKLDGEAEEKILANIFLEKLDVLSQEITRKVPENINPETIGFDFDDTLLRDEQGMQNSLKTVIVSLNNITGLRTNEFGEEDFNVRIRYKFGSDISDNYEDYEYFNLEDLQTNNRGFKEVKLMTTNFSDIIDFYTYEGDLIGRTSFKIPFLSNISLIPEILDLRLLNGDDNFSNFDFTYYKDVEAKGIQWFGEEALQATFIGLDLKTSKPLNQVNNLIGTCLTSSGTSYRLNNNYFELNGANVELNGDFKIIFSNQYDDIFKTLDLDIAPGNGCYPQGSMIDTIVISK